jgi:hypothetical protein
LFGGCPSGDGDASDRTITITPANTAVSAAVLDYVPQCSRIRIEINSFGLQEILINDSIYYIPWCPEVFGDHPEGASQLPVVHRSLIVPDSGEISARVVDSASVDYPATRVAPAKEWAAHLGLSSSQTRTLGPAYATEVYPTTIATVDTPFIARDLRGVKVNIASVQYLPRQRVLRVYRSIKLDVYVS